MPPAHLPEKTSEPLSDAERLVTLREFMEEGIRRSADGTIIGRRVAVVILDGSVEAAIGICLDQFGLESGDRLEDGYSKLVKHLQASEGVESGLAAWPEVRRLRRARNNAQHHGIIPDHDDLTRWSAAVMTFVEAAILATFGLSLSLVCFADAIRTPSLRDEFMAAEEQLAQDDVNAAIETLASVFDSARQLWDVEHRASRPHSPLIPSFRQNPDPTAAYVEDLLSVAMFASDLGEYVWWQSISNAVRTAPNSASVSAIEARRAMAFIYTWILRWEAFSASYTADRVGRIKGPVPPLSPYPDGRPVLLPGPITVEVLPPRLSATEPAPPRFVAVFPFVAGSTDVPWTAWRLHLDRAFWDQTLVPWDTATIRQTGGFVLTVAQDANGPQLRAALEDVLDRAASRKNAAEAESAQLERISERARVLCQTLTDLHTAENVPVFREVHTLRMGEQYPEPKIVMTVRATFADHLRHAALGRLTDRSFIASPLTGIGSLSGEGIDFPADAEVPLALTFVNVCLATLEEYENDRHSRAVHLEEARRTLEAELNDGPNAENPDS